MTKNKRMNDKEIVENMLLMLDMKIGDSFGFVNAGMHFTVTRDE